MITLSQKQQQDMHEILAWLRGGDATPNPEMEEKFIDTITGMVIDRMKPAGQKPVLEPAPSPARPRTELYKDRTHLLSLKALMREVTGDDSYELPKIEVKVDATAEPEAETQKKEATTDEVDSVILARTLVYMGKCNAHTVNVSQIQIILYNAYGAYLARNGKRLIDEHPQMWEYGPVFPKAYNKLRKNPSDGQTEAETLQKTRPEIYQFLSQCFQRYAWTSASMLSATHLAAGTPWTKTRKKSPDKWGVQIDDSLIEDWFKAQMKI